MADTQNVISQLRKKVAALKRRKRFISYRESGSYAKTLESLLAEIASGVDDPKEGLKLVTAFIKSDDAVFEACDDSNGSIGDVFRMDAADLFVEYGSSIDDKRFLSDLLLDLIQNDNYGVRDALLENARQFLPESIMRELVDRFWFLARGPESHDKYRWPGAIKLFARQLKDPGLFERAALSQSPEPSGMLGLQIARVYLDSGDATTALSWLHRIPKSNRLSDRDRDALALEIYSALGNTELRERVAWKMFRQSPNTTSLEKLLEVIGQESKVMAIDSQVKLILAEDKYSSSKAFFMVELGRTKEAASYVLSRRGELNGDFYSGLLALIEPLEKEGETLAVSVLYRALIDSVLKRAQTRYYSHGVRYLRKLGPLAESISDWQGVPDHETYMQNLRESHKRKRSFWSRFEPGESRPKE